MLVMIHGIGDCGADMAPVTDVLSGQLHTYAPSRRPLPASATFDDTVEDFLKQLDEEKIGPAYLLGYSFGGLIALTIAHRHPERVRGVIGLAAKVIYDERTMKHLRHIISADRLRQTIGHKVPAYERRWGMDLADIAASAMGMYESFAAKPPLADRELRAIEAPVLLISGERDQVTSPAETRRLAELIPDARFEFFPGGAHPLRAVPADQVKTAVLRFVREVEKGQFAMPAEERARAWLG